jgi:hypothetical protein
VQKLIKYSLVFPGIVIRFFPAAISFIEVTDIKICMGLETDLKENQIILAVMKKDDYSERIKEIVFSITVLYSRIIYVSLNKPFKTLKDYFGREGINEKRLLFIDAVTGKSGLSEDNRVVFIQSPKALTDLSIVINETFGKNPDCYIFDSLSTLLVYEDHHTVIKFVHSIIAKTREHNKKCVFTILEEDVNTEVMKDLNMFVDKTIY